jgi:hypothetical protein
MGVREDIRQLLKDGPQSIDEVCEAMPTTDKQTVRTSLAQMATAGQLIRKMEDGHPLYVLNPEWAKAEKRPLQYGAKTGADPMPQKPETKPARVETKPAAPETKPRKTAPKDAPRETRKMPVRLATSFAAAMSPDNRLVLIVDGQLAEFTRAQTEQIEAVLLA